MNFLKALDFISPESLSVQTLIAQFHAITASGLGLPGGGLQSG